MKIAHVTRGVCKVLFVIVTLQPLPPAARPMVPSVLPIVTQKLTVPAVGGVVHAVVALYLIESAKYDFDLVFANLGIAIAARRPMMTTTFSSSISVKPLRFIWLAPAESIRRPREGRLPYRYTKQAPCLTPLRAP